MEKELQDKLNDFVKDDVKFNILKLNDIENIAQGACFLASGGGGSLQITLNNIIPHYFNSDTRVLLLSADAPKDLFWGSVTACMGSPDSLATNPDLVKTALSSYIKLMENCQMEKAVNNKRFQNFDIKGLCAPVEIGAVNTIVPMIVANGLDSISYLPAVLDLDGAGRAVPTLPLTTYAGNIPLHPNILGGNNNTETSSHYFDYANLNVQDETTLETSFMGLIESKAFGVAAGLSMYAANGPDFASCQPVLNGISDSLQIGTIINQYTGTDRLNNVLNYITSSMNRQARQIFHGTISDMKVTTDGLDNGYVIITGDGSFTGQSFKITIENENIWGEITLAQEPTQPWIVGPDSICYLTDSGDVFDNSDLQTAYEAGQRPVVSIIGIRADKNVTSKSTLMANWAGEVASKKGPGSYISPWL